jgi:hypothetical protein
MSAHTRMLVRRLRLMLVRRLRMIGGSELQWVHGPRTVVMHQQAGSHRGEDFAPSMGPRSENRGYGKYPRLPQSPSTKRVSRL